MIRPAALTAFILVLLSAFVPTSGSAFAQGEALVEEPGTLRDLHRRIERLAGELRGPALRDPELEIAERREKLLSLEREVRLVEPEAASPLLDKLRRLGVLLDDVERLSAAGVELEAGPAATVSPNRVKVVPVNDTCTAALPVTLGGTVAGDTLGASWGGEASCGSSFWSPDAWFRYDATADGHVVLDLFGSGYDTVLSVHGGCPGTAGNEVACSDDLVGLESGLGFEAMAGTSYWIRVSGFDGAVGPFELHLGTGGTLSGTVEAAADQTPLAGGMVNAIALGSFTLTETTGAAGEYAFTGLSVGGPYILWTKGFPGFLEELYEGIPCPEGVCDRLQATRFGVPANGEVEIDFALGTGGAIAGTVTATATGDPIAGVTVEVWSGVTRIDRTSTDADGAYEIGGLPDGDYFVTAQSDEFERELYDDFPCSSSRICTWTGTPVPVALGTTTGGIDFALERLGVIAGKVTSTIDDAPIPDVRVVLYDNWYRERHFTFTDGSGEYRIGGLAVGSYFVVTESPAYGGELYDNFPCPISFFGLEPCSISAATPVETVMNVPTTGIDFDLTPFGAISGTVTEAKDGSPVVGATVKAWHKGELLSPMHEAVTDAAGRYLLEDLDFGDWFVVTDSSLADELYGGAPCESGLFGSHCQPEDGTPVPVVLNTTTTGVDFSLDRVGWISGSVTDAETGDPLPAWVSVADGDGRSFGCCHVVVSGSYTKTDLPPGTYYVEAVPQVSGYQRESYDDIGCKQSSACPRGTPVTVFPGTGTSGVDFAMERFGILEVTVVDGVTGDPVSGLEMEMHDLPVGSFDLATTLATGLARFTFLNPDQSYAVKTRALGPYLQELYDDVLCASSSCDVSKGEALQVGVGEVRRITMALLPSDATGIAGQVKTAAGLPFGGVTVDLWSEAGDHLGSVSTLASGDYFFPDLAPGTYHVSTANGLGLVDQVWRGVVCAPGGCDPTAGMSVEVADSGALSLAANVDFHLAAPAMIFTDGFESGNVSAWAGSSEVP